MGNGTDDWTGPGKKTETNDQAVGQMHDFGSCSVKDGKAVLVNEITSQVMGLDKSAEGFAQPDLTIPGGVDSANIKMAPAMAKFAGDIGLPGGVDKADVK